MEKKQFEEMINGEKPVLVDFFAEWCGPCQFMKPILEDLKDRLNGKAEIVTVDVDKSPQLASPFGIRGVPTLILFKKGEVQWRQGGVVQANELERIIVEKS